jgi:hypothetical protein
MDKIERARIIVDQVLALEPRIGRHGPPRAHHTTIPTRLISGDPSWEARISRGYASDQNGGEPWDLFELSVYGQQQLTAVVRGQDIVLRQYLPGLWERIFLMIDVGDTTPLVPGGMA